MQPTLALSMSTTGVVLYASTPDGWITLGRATFSARNMGTQMAVLRRIALAHCEDAPDTAPLTALLLVPEDQVLWTRFGTDGVAGDPAAVNAFIRSNLDGMTPYDAADLRFDWRRSGAGLDTAVIAIETLQEAEKFAGLHGFRPVGVAALTETGDFPATAWFGLSRAPHEPDGRNVIDAPFGDNIHALPTAAVPEITAPEASLSPAQMAAKLKTIDGETAPADPSAKAPPPVPRGPMLIGLSVALVAALAGAAYFLPTNDAPVSLPAQMAETSQTGTTQGQDEIARELPLAHVTPPASPTASDAASDATIDTMRLIPAFFSPIVAGVQPTDQTSHPNLAQPRVDQLLSVDALALDDGVEITAIAAPVSPVPPPPQGASFDVDTDGFVRPSSEGARAPGGYLVVTGQPPLAPDTRPVRNADTERTTRVAAPDDPLFRLRPSPRPGDLVDRFERQRYGGKTRAELLALRPTARAPDRAAAAEARFAALKPQFKTATADTARPVPRPAGLQQKARDAAVAKAQSAAAAASTAAVLTKPKPAAPKAAPASTPTTQSSAPNRSANAPTTNPSTPPANVARTATDPNEINLSKVSLLGTFGKSGAMRALVRMPNGRVVNVSVGDRVNGGRVVAIGQSELRYVKSGRNITLQMPRG